MKEFFLIILSFISLLVITVTFPIAILYWLMFKVIEEVL